MFLGQYRHDIDEEGWVAIPATYRQALSQGLIVTRGLEQALLAFDPAGWQALAGRLAALALTNPDARQLRRRLFASAVTLQLDDQGRIPLPPALRKFAGLSGEVVFAGQFDHIEIWEPGRWTAVELDAAAPAQDKRWEALYI